MKFLDWCDYYKVLPTEELWKAWSYKDREVDNIVAYFKTHAPQTYQSFLVKGKLNE
jgi:hypothetical protein